MIELWARSAIRSGIDPKTNRWSSPSRVAPMIVMSLSCERSIMPSTTSSFSTTVPSPSTLPRVSTASSTVC